MKKIELKKQFKQHMEYKDSGVEWIGKIPKDWNVEKLKYKTALLNGFSFDSENYSDHGLSIIRIGDVGQDISFQNTKKYPISYRSGLQKFRIKKGDILVALTGATIGKMSVYTYAEEAYLNQRVGIIRPGEQLLLNYLQYIIWSPIFKENIGYYCMGGAQDNIGKKEIGNILYSLPSEEGQQKIADYLDAKTEIIDKIIAQKQKLIELLKEKRATVINKAVTHGLDENVELVDSGAEWIGKVPKGWQVEKLKFVAGINRNTLSDTTGPNYNLKYIDIGNVDINGVKDEPEELNFENAPSRARRIVQKENTIIGTVRTYLKALAYFDNPESNLIVSTGFAVLEPVKSLLGKFIYYSVCSEKFIQNVSKWSTGVSYPAINPSALGCLPLCIPPIIEQQKIIKYLDVQISGIEVVKEKIKKSIELLQEYKSSLIYSVVTGKVKV